MADYMSKKKHKVEMKTGVGKLLSTHFNRPLVRKKFCFHLSTILFSVPYLQRPLATEPLRNPTRISMGRCGPFERFRGTSLAGGQQASSKRRNRISHYRRIGGVILVLSVFFVCGPSVFVTPMTRITHELQANTVFDSFLCDCAVGSISSSRRLMERGFEKCPLQKTTSIHCILHCVNLTIDANLRSLSGKIR